MSEHKCFFFLIPFFYLLPSWASCVSAASVVSHLSKCDMKSKTIWAPQTWTMCLIMQNKLIFVLSWQIHLKFWCSLKCCQSIWSFRQHNKATLSLPWARSWWKCPLYVNKLVFMLLIWNPGKKTHLLTQIHTHTYTLLQGLSVEVFTKGFISLSYLCLGHSRNAACAAYSVFIKLNYVICVFLSI